MTGRQRGNQVLLYKEDCATGSSVRFVSESGESIFPSGNAAYFVAEAFDDSDPPGLEGVDGGALDRDYLEIFGIDGSERFDVDGAGVPSIADTLRYRGYSQRLEDDDAGEISLEASASCCWTGCGQRRWPRAEPGGGPLDRLALE